MINQNYFWKNFRAHLSYIIFAFFTVGAFQILILTLVVEADILNLAPLFFQKFPPYIQQFISEEMFAQFSVSGAVGFGYDHPMVLTILAILAIMLPARHIAGEIEAGTLELLLSTPLKRSKIFSSLWFLAAVSLLIIIAGGWIGSVIGTIIYHQTLSLSVLKIFQMGINLWLLMLSISAITLFMSTFSREANRVSLRAAGITLFFFFLNYTAKLWQAASFLKHLTIFNYYQPQKIMVGQADLLKNFAVLTILIIVFNFVAFKKFTTRDIP